MSEEKEIQELIDMIDSFMTKGGGHLEISATEGADMATPEITISQTNDCLAGDKACKLPNLHKGVAEDETNI